MALDNVCLLSPSYLSLYGRGNLSFLDFNISTWPNYKFRHKLLHECTIDHKNMGYVKSLIETDIVGPTCILVESERTGVSDPRLIYRTVAMCINIEDGRTSVGDSEGWFISLLSSVLEQSQQTQNAWQHFEMSLWGCWLYQPRTRMLKTISKCELLQWHKCYKSSQQ